MSVICTLALSLAICSSIATIRLVSGNDCLTTQTDAAVFLLKQLEGEIDSAVCQLVKETTYSDHEPEGDEEFDFIVVGAGSAGAVVANRLSENQNWTVLLLEAGGDPVITDEIPALFGLSMNTDVDWGYRTEPEPMNCLGMVDQRCTCPRGKTLGGSSAINALLYVRGHPEDYDSWEAMGCRGWGYENLLNYFKKSEDFRVGNLSRYHGQEGLLKIENFQSDIGFFIEAFSEGFEELGYPSFSDVNLEDHEGFFTLHGTLKDTRRCSTAKGFLYDFQDRPNLKISKNSLATKILINQNKTAEGVTFYKNDQTFTAKAKKEVIVSGGSINSPQLLLLSGIGPREHLKSLGIEVVKQLDVGNNLQDHTLMRGFVVTLDIPAQPIDIMEDLFQFLIYSRGDFAGIGLYSLGGFIRSSQATRPDIQFYFNSFPANSTIPLRESLEALKFKEEIIQSYLQINSNRYTLFIMPALTQPKSRGSVLLKNTDPFDHPLIYPGYFFEEEDIQKNLEAIHFATRFLQTEPMEELGARVERIDIPDCNSFTFQSDDYWRCIIQQVSTTVYHPVGTCKMGARKDADTVVDPQLRVKGVKRLRVVDASVMPTIISGNTNAPTIAIAEKASDMIKRAWARKPQNTGP